MEKGITFAALFGVNSAYEGEKTTKRSLKINVTEKLEASRKKSKASILKRIGKIVRTDKDIKK